MSEDNVTIRICKTCKNPYPLTDEFFPTYKNRVGKILLRHFCIDCWKKKRATARKLRNPEVVKAEKKRSAKKHPESQKRRMKRFLERHPEYTKEQSAKHSVQNTIRATKWIEDNRDKFNARQRKRRKTNPVLKMKESVIRHKRRARMRQAEGSYTDADVRRIYDEQEGRCAYCGISIYWHIPYDIHIDHILPLARGGSNYPDNLACSCAECNLSKGDKTISEWCATRGW